jgi:hypothetical protein
MATTIPQVSLLIHFQLLHETLIFSESFTCLGISTKKVQCGRLIGTKAKKALSKLTWTTFRAIEENVGDIEQLLYEASFLVMCGYHQDQAEGQLKTWVEMGSSLTGQNSRHEHDVKVSASANKHTVTYHSISHAYRFPTHYRPEMRLFQEQSQTDFQQRQKPLPSLKYMTSHRTSHVNSHHPNATLKIVAISPVMKTRQKPRQLLLSRQVNMLNPRV